MKVTILKYDHRDGCDLSAHATYALANKARAEICVKFVDERIYTPPHIDDDPDTTVSEHVKALFAADNYDECVRVYLSFNQDESLDLEEVDVQGLDTLLSARELKQLEELLVP